MKETQKKRKSLKHAKNLHGTGARTQSQSCKQTYTNKDTQKCKHLNVEHNKKFEQAEFRFANQGKQKQIETQNVNTQI